MSGHLAVKESLGRTVPKEIELFPRCRNVLNGAPHQPSTTIRSLDFKCFGSQRTSGTICIVHKDAPVGTYRRNAPHGPTRAIMAPETNTLSLPKADAS